MILTLRAASVRYNCETNNFYSLANYHRKKGIPTPWIQGEKNQRQFIDTDAYERQGNIQKSCYDVNTTYLYWLMMELFDGEKQLAEFLSEVSFKYNSFSSWASWLNVDMWDAFLPMVVC